jgi:hypothetical protein
VESGRAPRSLSALSILLRSHDRSTRTRLLKLANRGIVVRLGSSGTTQRPMAVVLQCFVRLRARPAARSPASLCPSAAVRIRFVSHRPLARKGPHVEAFAVPIKPGKEETWKSWAAELNGARKAEFDEMNERMGLTTHAAWLQQNPDGSQLAVVVLDGPGASEFLGKLATSDHEFDTLFRTSSEDIHPMDFSAPPPPAPVRFL